MKPEHQAYNAWLNRDLETYRSILLEHGKSSECIRNTDGTPTGVWEDVVSAGDIPFARLLVEEFGIGVDESPFGIDQEGPIVRACENGHREMVAWLLALGAKINYLVDGKPCCRSLHCAIQERHLGLARFLVENGAVINDHYQESTALDTAIVWQIEEAVNWLRSIGGKTSKEIRQENPTKFDDPQYAHDLLLATFPLTFGNPEPVAPDRLKVSEIQSRFIDLFSPLVGTPAHPARWYIDKMLEFSGQVSSKDSSNQLLLEWGESTPHRLPGVVDLHEYHPEWEAERRQWLGTTLQIHTEDGEESLYLCLFLYFALADGNTRSQNKAGILKVLPRIAIKLLEEESPRSLLEQQPSRINAFVSD